MTTFYKVKSIYFSLSVVLSCYVLAEGLDDVSPGEEIARSARMVSYQGYNLANAGDALEMVGQDVPELIPVAENRKVRGNGADLSEEEIIGSNDEAEADAANAENGIDVEVEEVVGNADEDYQERLEREPAPDPKTEEEKAVATESVLKACYEDGETCSENAGCCSRFCSWTRGFICYTLNG